MGFVANDFLSFDKIRGMTESEIRLDFGLETDEGDDSSVLANGTFVCYTNSKTGISSRVNVSLLFTNIFNEKEPRCVISSMSLSKDDDSVCTAPIVTDIFYDDYLLSSSIEVPEHLTRFFNLNKALLMAHKVVPGVFKVYFHKHNITKVLFLKVEDYSYLIGASTTFIKELLNVR